MLDLIDVDEGVGCFSGHIQEFLRRQSWPCLSLLKSRLEMVYDFTLSDAARIAGSSFWRSDGHQHREAPVGITPLLRRPG